MTGRRWGPARMLAAGLAVFLMGCSDSPSGPGVVDVRIDADVPLGAVVLEVVGAGIVSVEGDPGGWTAAALPDIPAGESATFRVVAVADLPGALDLQLAVEDMGRRLPLVTVVEASDASDLPLQNLESVAVTVRRGR